MSSFAWLGLFKYRNWFYCTFQLGLTATPERTDGNESMLEHLIGPFVFRKEIGELAGSYLASYQSEIIHVDLSEDEKLDYENARKLYRDYLVKGG